MISINKFKSAFLLDLNFHRKLSVAAVLDIAKREASDITITEFDTVLEELTSKNLVSFSRQYEFFYLGKLDDHKPAQEPLPAEAIEALISSVASLRKDLRTEIEVLKKAK